MSRYSPQEIAQIEALHLLDYSAKTIADALGRTEYGVAAKLRRMNRANALASTRLGKVGRPCNQDVPKQVGVRVSKEIAEAIHEVTSHNGVKLGALICEALALEEDFKGAKKRSTLVLELPEDVALERRAWPRNKAVNTQIPTSVYARVSARARSKGTSVGTLVARAMHRLLEQLGYTLLMEESWQ